jgi:hypothetical protein
MFAIEVDPVLLDADPERPGRWVAATVVIGSFREKFHLPVSYWSVREFKQQWLEQSERLVQSGVPAVLLTGTAGDPAELECCPCWVLYPEGPKVLVQNILLLPWHLQGLTGWADVWRIIPAAPVLVSSDECTGLDTPASSWETTLEAVQNWCDSLRRTD